ncbi:MAG: 4-amino-4-deoxychorismate lyase, partial [Saprospiraceae bacterium]
MDNRPLLIESICIKHQKIQLLDYHNQRANDARFELFNIEDLLDFEKVVDLNEAKEAIVKCRIVYGKKIESIIYQPYELRPVNSLTIVDIDEQWNYNYKFLNRTQLDFYFSKRGDADDILMVQNGYVKDSYYGNLAFLKYGKWYTPEQPLLKGTRRASLIEKELIIEAQILKEEIQSFESVSIFNAMIEFG